MRTPRFRGGGVVVLGLLVLTGCADDPTAPELTDPRLFVTASAGGNHTCAITAEGRLFCWGLNHGGQLGDGTDQVRLTPTPVASSHAFSAVSAGASHTCALTIDGTAYCWGANGDGQLGIGTTEWRETAPTRVATDRQFISLSAGSAVTCAVDKQGEAYCWGSDYYEELGAAATDDCWAPCALAPVLVDTDVRFEQVTAGTGHTCGVSRSGRVYCWGRNNSGQLGTETTEPCPNAYDDAVPCSQVPVQVSGSGSYTEVATGWEHSCALTGDGAVHCWGSDAWGALGDGQQGDGFRHDPSPILGGQTFETISAEASMSCAVSGNGPTLCWGMGFLGDGTGEDSPVPVPVASSARFSQVTVGESHSCGLTREGVLYCWGINRYGQLGDDSGALGWPTPVAVKGW